MDEYSNTRQKWNIAFKMKLIEAQDKKCRTVCFRLRPTIWVLKFCNKISVFTE